MCSYTVLCGNIECKFYISATGIKLWNRLPVEIRKSANLRIFNDAILGGRGSISKVEGHWPKGALLYMIKIWNMESL